MTLAGTISPEWFFGAPLIGAVATVAIYRDRYSTQSIGAPAAAESFLQAQLGLEAEMGIHRRLVDEIERTVELLRREGEVQNLATYLGRDAMVRHLRAMEERRVGITREIERLARAEAIAHADLVAAAQEQGVQRARDLDPTDLLNVVVEEREKA